MKYPDYCKNVIDVTKAPYFADNSGKTDCTDVMRKIIDDCMVYVENSALLLIGGNVFCYPLEEEYCTALWVKNDGKEYKKSLKNCSILLSGKDALGRDWGRLIDYSLI